MLDPISRKSLFFHKLRILYLKEPRGRDSTEDLLGRACPRWECEQSNFILANRFDRVKRLWAKSLHSTINGLVPSGRWMAPACILGLFTLCFSYSRQRYITFFVMQGTKPPKEIPPTLYLGLEALKPRDSPCHGIPHYFFL